MHLRAHGLKVSLTATVVTNILYVLKYHNILYHHDTLFMPN